MFMQTIQGTKMLNVWSFMKYGFIPSRFLQAVSAHSYYEIINDFMFIPSRFLQAVSAHSYYEIINDFIAVFTFINNYSYHLST